MGHGPRGDGGGHGPPPPGSATVFSGYQLPVTKVIFAQLLSVIVNEIGLIAPICCMYIVHGASW